MRWQYWAEFESPAQQEEFQSFLDGYVGQQKSLGRYARPLNNRLTPVDQWLEVRRVVRDDQKVLVAVAALFLGVCFSRAARRRHFTGHSDPDHIAGVAAGR